jgi:hypothetical protein
VGRHYDNDVSVINAWIRNLRAQDYLSSGQA